MDSKVIQGHAQYSRLAPFTQTQCGVCNHYRVNYWQVYTQRTVFIQNLHLDFINWGSSDAAIRCEIINEDMKIIGISFKQFVIGDRNVQHLGGLTGRESDLIWTRSKVTNWEQCRETTWNKATSQNYQTHCLCQPNAGHCMMGKDYVATYVGWHQEWTQHNTARHKGENWLKRNVGGGNWQQQRQEERVWQHWEMCLNYS